MIHVDQDDQDEPEDLVIDEEVKEMDEDEEHPRCINSSSFATSTSAATATAGTAVRIL